MPLTATYYLREGWPGTRLEGDLVTVVDWLVERVEAAVKATPAQECALWGEMRAWLVRRDPDLTASGVAGSIETSWGGGNDSMSVSLSREQDSHGWLCVWESGTAKTWVSTRQGEPFPGDSRGVVVTSGADVARELDALLDAVAPPPQSPVDG